MKRNIKRISIKVIKPQLSFIRHIKCISIEASSQPEVYLPYKNASQSRHQAQLSFIRSIKCISIEASSQPEVYPPYKMHFN